MKRTWVIGAVLIVMLAFSGVVYDVLASTPDRVANHAAIEVSGAAVAVQGGIGMPAPPSALAPTPVAAAAAPVAAAMQMPEFDLGKETAAVVKPAAAAAQANAAADEKDDEADEPAPQAPRHAGDIQFQAKSDDVKLALPETQHEIAAPGQGLSRTMIKNVMHVASTQVRACYEQAGNGDPDLSGRVLLHWLIETDGSVSHVTIVESDLDSTQVEKCVVNIVKALTFPASDAQDAIEISYPFVFTAAN